MLEKERNNNFGIIYFDFIYGNNIYQSLHGQMEYVNKQ